MHFTSNGGTLVLEACAGLFDRDGLLRSHSKLLATWPVSKIMGLTRYSKLKSAGTICRGAEIYRGLQKQCVSVCEDDVDILATFSDGEPAVCQRAAGEGTVIWVGTFCASAPRNTADEVSPVTRWAANRDTPRLANCPHRKGPSSDCTGR